MDTNVLVYAYDAASPYKRSQAAAVLNALKDAGFGAISTQVLSEFFYAVTRRLRPPLPPDVALLELKRHARVWTILNTTVDVIVTAAHAAGNYQLNFRDGQLWAAAKLNGVTTILSEDFNSGTTLGGVRFLNPFAPGFRLQ